MGPWRHLWRRRSWRRPFDAGMGHGLREGGRRRRHRSRNPAARQARRERISGVICGEGLAAACPGGVWGGVRFGRPFRCRDTAAMRPLLDRAVAAGCGRYGRGGGASACRRPRRDLVAAATASARRSRYTSPPGGGCCLPFATTHCCHWSKSAGVCAVREKAGWAQYCSGLESQLQAVKRRLRF